MDGNDQNNIMDIAKMQRIRRLRQSIKECSEVVETQRNFESFRVLYDDSVMNDPRFDMPIPDAERFELNSIVKAGERAASALDESNKKSADLMEDYIRFLENELAEIQRTL